MQFSGDGVHLHLELMELNMYTKIMIKNGVNKNITAQTIGQAKEPWAKELWT
jgi:hypothetical protein